MGITYSELLDLDIRKFNCLVDGFSKRRETNMNDQLIIGHRIAGKIAQAVWGSKEFRKPIPKFEFAETETSEDKIRRRRNAFLYSKYKGK